MICGHVVASTRLPQRVCWLSQKSSGKRRIEFGAVIRAKVPALVHGRPRLFCRPEVGFEEIGIDLLQARFWIVSVLPTIQELGLVPSSQGACRWRSGNSVLLIMFGKAG